MQSAPEQNPQPSTCGELCWSGEGTVQVAGNKPVLSNLSDVCQALIKGEIFLSHRMVLLRKEITVLHQDQDIIVKIQRKRCSLKRLGAFTEWTYVSRNSIKRKACLRPHWLIVWSPASAGALSTLCSGAGASTEGDWPFDTSGADHTQKVVLQQGAPRHCRQSNASVHRNGGMNVSHEQSSLRLFSTTVSAKDSFSLPVLNGYVLSWFSNLEAA